MADNSIRVLLVEDSENDAALVLRELSKAGYIPTCQRVDTRDAMIRALEQDSWEVILADYALPNFDAPSALSVIEERGLDIPFLVVSGTIGEDVAVAVMKLGAHDYILKDKLARLVPAIERELREAAIRAEQKRMRRDLLVAERMAAIGSLAAGVAHEINNPLAALCVNLEVMARDLAELNADTQLRAWQSTECFVGWLNRIRERMKVLDVGIEGACEAANRVREIVKDLRVFARPSDERRAPVDVHTVLDSAIRLALPVLRHRAKVIREYGNVPHIIGNEGRLTQVFLNLIVNAAQAADPEATPCLIRLTTEAIDRGRVRVSIEDTGKGISPEVLPRIFDPFFSTKPAGEGTGLGLSICQRIVSESKGEISVSSVPGRGTTFSVSLPGLAEEIEEYTSAVVPVARGLRILVLDDDAIVADAIRKLLALEHNVTALTNAHSALLQIERGERFDLVLCDLPIPNMSSNEFRDAVCALAPDQAQNIVFMSSGLVSPPPSSRNDSELYVEKPLDEETLRMLVRRFGERARRAAAQRAG